MSARFGFGRGFTYDARAAADAVVVAWDKPGAPSLRDLIAAAIERERGRCAKLADDRAAICADACERITAGTLYPDTPSAFATENCARMEAEHIARLIRGDAKPHARPEERAA